MENFERNLLKNYLSDLGIEGEFYELNLSYGKLPYSEIDNIYILKTTSTWGNVLYKMGYTSNIKKRLLTYYSSNPLIVLKESVYIPRAAEVEKYIHRKFKATLGEEWYNEETISSIINILNVLKLDIDASTNSIFNVERRIRVDYLLSGGEVDNIIQLKDANTFELDAVFFLVADLKEYSINSNLLVSTIKSLK